MNEERTRLYLQQTEYIRDLVWCRYSITVKQVIQVNFSMKQTLWKTHKETWIEKPTQAQWYICSVDRIATKWLFIFPYVEIGLYIGGTTYLGQTISIYIMLKYLTIWNQISQAKPRYILKPEVKSTSYLQAMDRVTHMSNTRIDIPNTHIHGQSLPELGTGTSKM
jgi:hypothetical protein